MELKTFQRTALDLLRRYLEAARVVGPAAAFTGFAEEGNPGHSVPAYRQVPDLEAVPYVCLRLPTGGGKTFLASETVGVAARALLERDYPVVLWLVPSTVIRNQTVEALKNSAHPYRRQLDQQFGGRVGIYDLSEFEQIRPQDLTDQACIIVATIQSFRVTNTEGRRIYAHSEAFETHFAKIAPNAPGLERHAEGSGRQGIKFSFANILCLHRPLVLVDEAHNARTELSYRLLRAVNPACIVEFTATPRSSGENGSNVLYRASAAELNAAEMIKLPVNLTEYRGDWRAAVAGAVDARKRLLELAADEQPFVRPIALFQAQNSDKEVTVEVLKRHLIEHEKVPQERIAIATGNQRELDGVNLLDPQCAIDHVITVEALKEGWDCPFAYVFCSVADVRSQTAVEQLLGRVLRMPYAIKRRSAMLNHAYAFVSSDHFGTAAQTLRDKMVASMGFEPDQADAAVQESAPGDLFSLSDGGTWAPKPVQGHYELAEEPALEVLSEDERRSVAIGRTEDGAVLVTITGAISEALEEKIVAAAPPDAREGIRENIRHQRLAHRQSIAPVKRGERIIAPNFLLRLDGDLQEPDQRGFLSLGSWRLSNHSAELTRAEFGIEETGERFIIDLAGTKIEIRHVDQQRQLELGTIRIDWSEGELIRWLDREIKAHDLGQADKLEFCRRVVAHLIGARGIKLETLVRFKFPLLQAVRDKISRCRAETAETGFDRSLFGDEHALVLNFDAAEAFTFDAAKGYAPNFVYRGAVRFSREFYGYTGDLKSSGEEFECARWIDANDNVKHWFRNISGDAGRSLWLPTSTDRFYPDFVAELKDSRILVVEYKGAHIADNSDSKEKANIGEAYEARSGGKALFLMAVLNDTKGRDVRRQIAAKIDGTY